MSYGWQASSEKERAKDGVSCHSESRELQQPSGAYFWARIRGQDLPYLVPLYDHFEDRELFTIDLFRDPLPDFGFENVVDLEGLSGLLSEAS
jgi:hypothetical protein